MQILQLHLNLLQGPLSKTTHIHRIAEHWINTTVDLE